MPVQHGILEIIFHKTVRIVKQNWCTATSTLIFLHINLNEKELLCNYRYYIETYEEDYDMITLNYCWPAPEPSVQIEFWISFQLRTDSPFPLLGRIIILCATTAAFAYNYGNKIIRKLILGCKWPKNRKKWNSIGMLSCLMRLWSWISFLRFAFKQYHFKGLSLWAIRWICSSHSKPALPHQITWI